ncbi:SRPBCC family protein [Phototrophicus methaneseepsis]|uniref:SRPBCC family protein n=1 Tax=Phototrophicus methaneseepsis TaxID=2710758 RepID=A0A7S8E7B4_9CHLR|nr:SRPBCC family protein [Phototrophicus methaneseepsis]QPC81700.1 SRPBCC family protein [Phototrophicus methaneseepsis]
MNTNLIYSKVEMLIRKPISEVFEAFINPEITSKFWFTKSSGRLDEQKEVTWTWEMYNVSSQVVVKEIEKDKRILIEWDGYESRNTVEWIFTIYEGNTTFVSVTESGFQGDSEQVISDALNSKGGFTWLLAGAKAFLEFGIELNLVTDAFPKGINEH